MGFVFFSQARIGLLVEPGQETEKLIIVPSARNVRNPSQQMQFFGNLFFLFLLIF